MPSDTTPDNDTERDALLAALTWQIELGADEAIGETPLDRFALPAQAPAFAAPQPPPAATPPEPAPARPRKAAVSPAAATPPAGDKGADAAALTKAPDLATLARLGEAMDAPTLKPAARRFVFSDGNPAARLMIVGEAPGGDEDRLGRPFVGRAGQLLDRMLAAIGLDRTADDPARAVYIANILPWRPAGNRTPTADEIALFLPLIERHIALAAPERLLLLGNTPLKALTGESTGITRARGRWGTHKASGIAMMASFHPAYLLRSPEKKREAWADLLSVADALDLPYPKA